MNMKSVFWIPLDCSKLVMLYSHWPYFITMRVRNRDAAVRSRERKKEYVTDLEKKSKYLERECMRLGRMLECFVAENQSLRLCLQKGSGNVPMMTRQESAVLLLESLLLGSLLWYLGDIICQFPHMPQTKSRFQLMEAEEPEKLVQSGLESSRLSNNNTAESRRCKGSRPRMKHQVFTLWRDAFHLLLSSQCGFLMVFKDIYFIIFLSLRSQVCLICNGAKYDQEGIYSGQAFNVLDTRLPHETLYYLTKLFITSLIPPLKISPLNLVAISPE
ncbi:unnamed protein product [Thlaspi arvense]|uniref:BZIP domain-containing protein n=1 Tax=Thlaspi arvense TaxID=13288 RepID=A0AAU9R7Q7_THLAR|nr:unnamed protein product [Thlaspi arvense]